MATDTGNDILPFRRPVNSRIEKWCSFIRESLFRTTSSGKMIPAIDGLRCLAIAAVVFFHLAGYVSQRTPGLEPEVAQHSVTYQLLHVGDRGVQLFFVISGFILGLPFAEHFLSGKHAVPLGKYYARRVRRLHPPYLVNLAIFSVLQIATNDHAWSEVGQHLLARSFYVHNLTFATMSHINCVAWSLEIEVQFYLIAPFLAFLYRIPQSAARRSLFASSIGAVVLMKWYIGDSASFRLSTCVLYYLDYFLCGMLLADWQVSRQVSESGENRNGGWWDAIGLWAGFCSLAIMLSDGWAVVLPFMFLPFCAGVLRGSWLSWLFSRPILVMIGGMCYSIYLYHYGVISLSGRLISRFTAGCSFPVAMAIQSAVVIPTALAASTVFFLLCEKPFMSVRKTASLPKEPPRAQSMAA